MIPVRAGVAQDHPVDSSAMVPWDAYFAVMQTDLAAAEILTHPDSLLFDVVQVGNKPLEVC